VLACVLPSIREATFSYPLAIFTNSCVDAPEEGAVRGGAGRGERAVCMGAPRASSQPRPLPLRLASSASSLSCLSLCSFSSLLISQPLSRGMGLQEQGQGVHTGTLGTCFYNHPQIFIYEPLVVSPPGRHQQRTSMVRR
jgi:hypothetical protein